MLPNVAYSTSEAVMALRLTMAFSDNPRVQPLKDGAVKPQGIDLNLRHDRTGHLILPQPGV